VAQLPTLLAGVASGFRLPLSVRRRTGQSNCPCDQRTVEAPPGTGVRRFLGHLIGRTTAEAACPPLIRQLLGCNANQLGMCSTGGFERYRWPYGRSEGTTERRTSAIPSVGWPGDRRNPGKPRAPRDGATTRGRADRGAVPRTVGIGRWRHRRRPGRADRAAPTPRSVLRAPLADLLGGGVALTYHPTGVAANSVSDFPCGGRIGQAERFPRSRLSHPAHIRPISRRYAHPTQKGQRRDGAPVATPKLSQEGGMMLS